MSMFPDSDYGAFIPIPPRAKVDAGSEAMEAMPRVVNVLRDIIARRDVNEQTVVEASRLLFDIARTFP